MEAKHRRWLFRPPEIWPPGRLCLRSGAIRDLPAGFDRGCRSCPFKYPDTYPSYHVHYFQIIVIRSNGRGTYSTCFRFEKSLAPPFIADGAALPLALASLGKGGWEGGGLSLSLFPILILRMAGRTATQNNSRAHAIKLSCFLSSCQTSIAGVRPDRERRKEGQQLSSPLSSCLSDSVSAATGEIFETGKTQRRILSLAIHLTCSDQAVVFDLFLWMGRFLPS